MPAQPDANTMAAITAAVSAVLRHRRFRIRRIQLVSSQTTPYALSGRQALHRLQMPHVIERKRS